MAEKTDIEWADDTFNSWEGCQETGSPACVGCYAKVRNARFNGGVAVNWGPHAPRRRTSEATWRKPHLWNREQAAKEASYALIGKTAAPRFVFCASLADVFDNAVPTEWRRDLFDLIRATPHLTWLLLTKRPQMIVKLFADTLPSADDKRDAALAEAWPRNAALGSTVVTQPEADRDLVHLLMAAAVLKPAFTFASVEPMAEAMDLRRLSTLRFRGAELLNALTGELRGMFGDFCPTRLPALDWVIAGGMSGPKATPSHPDWYRSLRDQCAVAGVPFLFKQWGEWREAQEGDEFNTALGRAGKPPALIVNPRDGAVHCFLPEEPDPRLRVMVRVGKKAAGRTLDGVIHDARPEVRRG